MLGWLIAGAIIGFFASSMGIGISTFPFEKVAAEKQEFIDRYCLNENGTDNGQCTIEPVGMGAYLVNGLVKIFSLGGLDYTWFSSNMGKIASTS